MGGCKESDMTAAEQIYKEKSDQAPASLDHRKRRGFRKHLVLLPQTMPKLPDYVFVKVIAAALTAHFTEICLLEQQCPDPGWERNTSDHLALVYADAKHQAVKQTIQENINEHSRICVTTLCPIK